jgi:hypothetical protein
MSPHHFAAMYRANSHRHDLPSDGQIFNKDMGAITGMLYSIVTLKAFFPSSPAPEMNKYPVKDAAGGDSKYTQLTLF